MCLNHFGKLFLVCLFFAGTMAATTGCSLQFKSLMNQAGSVKSGASGLVPLTCASASYADYFSLDRGTFPLSCMSGVTDQGATSAFDAAVDTSFGPVLGGDDEFCAVASGPDGSLFFFSWVTRRIVKYDLAAGTTTEVVTPATAPAAWLANTMLNGAYLHPNGKIYVYTFWNADVGMGRDVVMEFDPQTYAIQMFGSGLFEEDGSGDIASGASIGLNGKLYLFPDGHTQVNVFDPVTHSVTQIGSVTSVGNHWIGGVTAPNGKVYGLPFTGTDILEIDTRDDSVTTFGSITAGGSSKFRGAAMAANGKIYAFPSVGSETRVLEVDPDTHATQYVANVGSGWFRAVLAPSGKIFASHQNNQNILEFDPATYAFTVHTTGVGTWGWNALSLAADGRIYGAGRGGGASGQLLILDPKGAANFPTSLTLSPHLNGSH